MQGSAQSASSQQGQLLGQTGDVVRILDRALWAWGEDLGEDSFISLAKVTEVVKTLPNSKVSGVDEIHPEML